MVPPPAKHARGSIILLLRAPADSPNSRGIGKSGPAWRLQDSSNRDLHHTRNRFASSWSRDGKKKTFNPKIGTARRPRRVSKPRRVLGRDAAGTIWTPKLLGKKCFSGCSVRPPRSLVRAAAPPELQLLSSSVESILERASGSENGPNLQFNRWGAIQRRGGHRFVRSMRRAKPAQGPHSAHIGESSSASARKG